MKAKIQEIVAKLTLEEKAGLCSGLDFWHTKGVERLGIPSVMMTDGPHGLRKQSASADHLGLNDSVPATCFPSAAGLAASWNRGLIRRVGEALGKECQAEGVAMLLGPGTNIKRSPLCGRNFEYFSEDPYLSSEMAAHHIQGVQSQGVGTSLKHFAANNQEHRRMSTDAVVDERTLREIYLRSFEGAVVQSQPWSVMCSYNRVNGEYASEHHELLTKILRDQWGFEGFVVSDWGAVNDRVRGLAAGLELEMPSSGGAGDAKIVAAVKAGSLPEATLDRAVERILTFVFKAAEHRQEQATFDAEAHHRLARIAAQESMVLLKNEGGLLPLRKEGTIAVIGEFAEKPRYQGGGSSHVNPTRLDLALEEMGKIAGDRTTLVYSKGFELDRDDVNAELLRDAVRKAENADTAVLFIGLPDRYESEGYDRTHMRLPANQVAVLEAVAQAQPNLVVVLSNGSPVEMPWIGKAKAVLEGYLGGQAAGGAVADLLFGEANPSGKLAETFPVRLQDNPSYLFFPGEGDRVEYREGIFVGYRYYDTKEVEPLFPFGHGLSYTSFEYADLKLDKNRMRDDDQLTVSLQVTNTGNRAGQEIVQLYVRDVDSSVIRPDKELKGFCKVELQPGETQTVVFELDKSAFAYYETRLNDWHAESGEYRILIGKSSREIVLEAAVEVDSTTEIPVVYTANTLIGDLLGRPESRSVAMEMMGATGLAGESGGELDAMMEAMMKYMPLRGAVAFSQGQFTEEMLSGLLERLNGGAGNQSES
ncbi:glycoside hydrolase family 3 C-terminal domain-containing protein [Paenibacillus phocaensis]|uniref:glycoside hydrolase family 3 C-terminal domain-containing protein n=1 Tax=Paenibacillus phocaensis TaxID=1776378 RepID=UPI00039B1C7D|nr:glycoside hydrolase family 3 C-terminal domain-containing protein [Paenibacillus phocaensis]